MNQFGSRIVRAIRLDATLYEEVEADRGAIMQAMGVVVLSSLAVGFATWFQGGIAGILLAVFAALVGWVLWAGIIYFVGTQMLAEPQTETDWGELLRVLGFASAPGLFRAFAAIHIFAPVVFFIASVWMLIATIIAVQSALDYKGVGKAVAVCLVGWFLQMFLVWFLLAVNNLLFVAAG